jgi:hypothetical protein
MTYLTFAMRRVVSVAIVSGLLCVQAFLFVLVLLFNDGDGLAAN